MWQQGPRRNIVGSTYGLRNYHGSWEMSRSRYSHADTVQRVSTPSQQETCKQLTSAIRVSRIVSRHTTKYHIMITLHVRGRCESRFTSEPYGSTRPHAQVHERRVPCVFRLEPPVRLAKRRMLPCQSVVGGFGQDITQQDARSTVSVADAVASLCGRSRSCDRAVSGPAPSPAAPGSAVPCAWECLPSTPLMPLMEIGRAHV